MHWARKALPSLVVSAVACSDAGDGAVWIAPPAEDFALLVAAELDAEDHALSWQMVHPESPVHFKAHAGAERVAFIAISQQALADNVPGFLEEMLSEAMLVELNDPTCEAGRFETEGDRERWTASLSALGTSIFETEIGGSGGLVETDQTYPFLSERGVSLVADLERCPGFNGTFNAFGSEPFLRPGESIQRMVALSADRIVATSAHALTIFERGAGFIDDPVHVRSSTSGPLRFTGLAVDRGAGGPDQVRVYAGLRHEDADNFPTGGVLSCLIGPEGFDVPSCELTPTPNLVNDIAVDPRGRVLVVGHELLWAKDREDDDFTALETSERFYLARAYDFDEVRFIAAGANGSMFIGDPLDGAWEREIGESESGFVNFRAVLAREVEEGVELWAAASKGTMQRRAPSSRVWTEIPFVVASSARACLAGETLECGGLRLTQSVHNIVSDGDGSRMFFALEACSVVLIADPVKGCAASAPLEGLERVDAVLGELRALSTFEERIFVGGFDSGLWEYVPPAAR